MLALALVAIIIACIVLYLEVADYGSPPYQAGVTVPVRPELAASAMLDPPGGLEVTSLAYSAIRPQTPVHG
jgi:hypothetical protein